MVDGGFRCGRSESFREPTRDGMVFDADDVLLFRPRIDGDRLGVPIEVRQGLLSRRRGEPPELMEPFDTRAIRGSEGSERAPRRTRTTATTPNIAEETMTRLCNTTSFGAAIAMRIPAAATIRRTALRQCILRPGLRNVSRLIRSNESHRCMPLTMGTLLRSSRGWRPLLTIWLLQAFKAARVIRSL